MEVFANKQLKRLKLILYETIFQWTIKKIETLWNENPWMVRPFVHGGICLQKMVHSSTQQILFFANHGLHPLVTWYLRCEQNCELSSGRLGHVVGKHSNTTCVLLEKVQM
jgi:hypothetical protein